MKVLNMIFALILSASCNHSGPKLDLKSNLQSEQKSITIKNTGNEDLVIEDFTTTCECTLIKLQKGQKVAPRDSLIVSVIVEKTVSAETSKVVYITIRTNTRPAITTLNFVN